MRAHDEELERLRVEVDCVSVLEKSRQGWTLDKEESTARALKYRCGAHIVIVNHEGRGWWDPQRTSGTKGAQGDVFDLVQYLHPGLNFGQVRKELRQLVGMAPSYPPFVRVRRVRGADLPPGERWQTRRRLRRGSPTWHYLCRTRCLPGCVLAAAASIDAVREGPYGSAWFAHRDHDGELTGIEMRGPRFRGFSSDGRKTLFRLPGSTGTITRLAVFEAPIDALSLAAIERIRPDTLYVSTTGGMGPDTVAELRRLMESLALRPCGKLIAATDNDRAGHRYAEALGQMAAEANLPAERLCPEDRRKDWNEVLQAQSGRAGT